MRGLLEDLGYEVISQEANHDVKMQNDQIENMVTQGAEVIIVIAEDGDSAATAVTSAAASGVKGDRIRPLDQIPRYRCLYFIQQCCCWLQSGRWCDEGAGY